MKLGGFAEAHIADDNSGQCSLAREVEGLAVNLFCHKFHPIQGKIDNTMKVEMGLPDLLYAGVS